MRTAFRQCVSACVHALLSAVGNIFCRTNTDAVSHRYADAYGYSDRPIVQMFCCTCHRRTVSVLSGHRLCGCVNVRHAWTNYHIAGTRVSVPRCGLSCVTIMMTAIWILCYTVDSSTDRCDRPTTLLAVHHVWIRSVHRAPNGNGTSVVEPEQRHGRSRCICMDVRRCACECARWEMIFERNLCIYIWGNIERMWKIVAVCCLCKATPEESVLRTQFGPNRRA